MIKSIKEKQMRPIEIDLTGPDGNAFVLLGIVGDLGKKLGYDKKVISDIQNTMMLGNYDQLVETFDIWFGEHVILYK